MENNKSKNVHLYKMIKSLPVLHNKYKNCILIYLDI